jgi:hypothetical protein
MLDTSPIVLFALAINAYPPADIEADISVFNGIVTMTIEEWDKVSHRTVFREHIVCDSHHDACIVQATLQSFINHRPVTV